MTFGRFVTRQIIVGEISFCLFLNGYYLLILIVQDKSLLETQGWNLRVFLHLILAHLSFIISLCVAAPADSGLIQILKSLQV